MSRQTVAGLTPSFSPIWANVMPERFICDTCHRRLASIVPLNRRFVMVDLLSASIHTFRYG